MPVRRRVAVLVGAATVVPAGVLAFLVYPPLFLFVTLACGVVAGGLVDGGASAGVVAGAGSGLVAGLPLGWGLGIMFLVSSLIHPPRLSTLELLSIPLQSPFAFVVFLFAATWFVILGAIGGTIASVLAGDRPLADR